MKILSLQQIREADAFTIKNEPIDDIDLMERAAGACYTWIREHVPSGQDILVAAGTGNNGGDGLAIARMLKETGYRVRVYLAGTPDRMSPNCRINYQRCMDGGMPLIEESDLQNITPGSLIVDALLGNAVTREVEGELARVIRHLNDCDATIISIDLPSGMVCDAHTPSGGTGEVIRATHTLTFAPPKMGLFFPENERYLGQWHLLDIGLSRSFMDQAMTSNHMTDEAMLLPLLRRRSKFAHKGHFGHALIIAGSRGKMGAAVLSALACLRAGSGLVTARIPDSGIPILQGSVPEAMLLPDPDAEQFSSLPDISAFSAIGVGPGIGQSPETAKALKLLIQQSALPVVFDADALNLLSENKTWLGFLPANSILTPHPKEFERLAGKSSGHFERNERQRSFSVKYQCFIVLKGAHTAVTTPGGECYFNTTGNPGMATAGSGDVLTGIITGLLAQGYSPLASSVLGVFLHGLAGDFAAQDTGFEALIARDIINNLGKSFQHLYGKL